MGDSSLESQVELTDINLHIRLEQLNFSTKALAKFLSFPISTPTKIRYAGAPRRATRQNGRVVRDRYAHNMQNVSRQRDLRRTGRLRHRAETPISEKNDSHALPASSNIYFKRSTSRKK